MNTIASRGENFLTAMVRNHKLGKVKSLELDGYLFIDRNGRAFEYVLEYLRTGVIHLENTNISKEILKIEFDFYEV